MNEAMNERLAKVVARCRRQKMYGDEGSSQHDRQRRRTRERVLAELPRLVSRMTFVIADLNEQMSDDGIIIVLAAADHAVAAEAVYTLALADDAADDSHLLVSVDWNGATHAVLNSGAARSLVLASTIFDLDEARITELVMTFLESRFP